MQRKIIGYHQDVVQDWVAELACGHQQHVRHNPPWCNRPWVVPLAGRRSRLGMPLDCTLCERPAADRGDAYAAVAELYAHGVSAAEHQDVAFFVEIAREAGGPVFEIGCGTGRVLIPTVQAGIEIVGLDASARMLTVCQAQLARQPEAVQARVTGLVQGDMRQFALGQTFRLVTLPFGPFQHVLTVADQCACLTTIHHHLAGGGSVILDLFHPSLDHLLDNRYGLAYSAAPAVRLADGRQVRRHHRYVARDLVQQVLTLELRYDSQRGALWFVNIDKMLRGEGGWEGQNIATAWWEKSWARDDIAPRLSAQEEGTLTANACLHC